MRERAVVAALAAAAAGLVGYLATAPPPFSAFPGPFEVLAPAGVLLGLGVLGLGALFVRWRRR